MGSAETRTHLSRGNFRIDIFLFSDFILKIMRSSKTIHHTALYRPLTVQLRRWIGVGEG